MRRPPGALYDTAQWLLGRFGLHGSRRTSGEDLARLVRSLRPHRTDFELIRLGPEADAGYLVPDDLEGIEYAFSPGVSTESGFDAALADRGVLVHMADASVDGPAEPHPRFRFEKRYIGCTSNLEFTTLDDWKARTIGDHRGDLLLQMDIEGAEYETLLAATDDLLEQFRVLVIEFHNLGQLPSRPFFDIASRAFDKLLRRHSVVHLHPNNCCGSVRVAGLAIPRDMEITFHRNDRFTDCGIARSFPHPLDFDNEPTPSLSLPECWYRSN